MRTATLTALALLAAPALADVKVYQNDSLGGGGTVACQLGFVANEIGAAIYTVPPGDGKVLLLEAQWWACAPLGLGQPRPMEVLVYPSGGPDPGAPAYTSPAVTATPGFLNIWQMDDANVKFDAGSTFTVGIKLLPAGPFNLTTLATDADGCQLGKSLIFAIPGGWGDACSFGVSGDMFVRAKVLTEGPVLYGAGTAGTGGQVPSIDSSGPWWVGGANFGITVENAAGIAPGFLGFSTAPASLPLFGGTVLFDPTAAGATFLPVATSPAGTAAALTPIPGNPGLVGVHVYFQYGFLDAGAPGGVSMSRGLDVKISNQ